MTAPPQPARTSRAAALVAHLQDLAEREDRGALAALRRGLGKEPGTTPEMYPLVEPFLRGARPRETEAAYIVASLFGLHPVRWRAPEHTYNTSVGWSLSHIRTRDDGQDDDGVARRFVALLNCERDALPTHLRQLLSLLHGRADAAAVDWEQLYWDIVRWDGVHRHVQRAWAAGFWRGGKAADAAGATPDPDATGDDASDALDDNE